MDPPSGVFRKGHLSTLFTEQLRLSVLMWIDSVDNPADSDENVFSLSNHTCKHGNCGRVEKFSLCEQLGKPANSTGNRSLEVFPARSHP